MKRFLVGLTVFSTVVGLGAVGAFYGHHWLAQAEVPAAQPEASAAPRDLTPQPLPLAAAEPAALPEGNNPFAASPAELPQPTEEENDTAQVVEPAAEAAPPEDVSAADDQVPAEMMQGDIPHASQISETDPAAPGDGFAEQTASAVEPAIEPAEKAAPGEPRALEDAPARGQLDRYGRQAAAPAAVEPAEAAAPAIAPVPVPVPVPAASEAADTQPQSVEGTGRPGDPRLSGTQAPTLTIEKTAPPEIQIGKPAKFLIKVRNAGSVVAHGVSIHDTVPQGTQLVSTTPPATSGENGELVWELGTLKPGDEQKAELELMPTSEGEIGSVATVQFRAEASVRTMATKPMLEMEVTAPDKIMKGQEVPLKIKLSNPGSGAATGIVLSESVPEGLTHPGGQELEFDVGTLKPGETRELSLGLMAAEPGTIVNTLTAQGDANLKTEVQTALEIVAPQLEVNLTGPKRRYLERNATHNISVSNPGTASAKDIELVAVLPRELKFVGANNNGQFDAATHSVYWSLEELPPQQTGTVTLTTLPMQAGEAKLLVKSTAKQNLTDQHEETVAIEGVAAINFQLSDASDPIEVNGQTVYGVRVTNQGTKAAGNVQLVVLLPPEMKGISAEGPVRYRIEGQRVVFEPLKQLPPKGETAYRVTAQALQPGDLRVQVQVSTDDIRDPITREESTRVFGDE